eukprot:CAMPEP_0117588930 /NCGR_PEP_ID=MMETSP0784-20121206/70123_1 /TAXON_ID=39447 /ORGANISM="" /LENGTH=264 /DNA_ID=CAMNT_0005390341 /DNA_START=15 /DNA_END=809 /DNA_ORIENTATION=+
MRSLPQAMPSLLAASAASAPLPRVSVPTRTASTTRGLPNAGDRHCFICLQDDDKDNPLIRCCTTCYARTHIRCWREWRNNQRITALRSRLLGLRTQTNHLLRCTICKSGTAVVSGEEDGLEWMNELLCGGEAGGGEGDARTVQLTGLGRRTDSDEEHDTHLEELVNIGSRSCGALAVYLLVLIAVLFVACTLIAMQRFYAGDVVLCCVIALYELSVLQIVVLAVARRRGAMVAAAGEDASMSASAGVSTAAASSPATPVAVGEP